MKTDQVAYLVRKHMDRADASSKLLADKLLADKLSITGCFIWLQLEATARFLRASSYSLFSSSLYLGVRKGAHHSAHAVVLLLVVLAPPTRG